MQTCIECNSSIPDEAAACPECGAASPPKSEQAMELKSILANTRARAIRIQVAHDACPACAETMGTYEKGLVPTLPVESCSHENGCRCHYSPILDEIFP